MKNFANTVLLLFVPINIFAQSVPGIFINEFLASNISNDPEITDFDDYSDWIELYNGEDFDLNIGGYYISDNPDRPDKWQFPENTIIPARDFLRIWADDYDEIPGQTYRRPYYPYTYFSTRYYHLNFKLAREGEYIGLYSPDTVLIDSVTYDLQLPDVSRGRQPDGAANWLYFGEPTPGQANTGPGITSTDYTDVPEISLAGGFYNGSQQVILTSNSDSAEIRYTLDGSKPVNSSTLYQTPLTISLNTVLRVRCFENNKLPSSTLTRTYFIDENILLPVISIATIPELLWNDSLGIYQNNYKEREIPVHFEFYAADQETEFSLDAGLTLTGQASLYYPQKSFTIRTSDDYGPDIISYQVFPTRELDAYTDLYLRNAGVPDHRSTFFRDALLHSLVINKMDVECQAYRPAVIFLNGEYWGILNIRDKINKEYIGSLHNLNPDDVDLLEYENNAVPTVMAGNADNYNAFYSYIQSHDLSQTDYYCFLENWMDMEEYINYQISEIYCDNVFWLDQNVRMWRERKEDGKWRWVLFDTDYGFGMPNQRPNGFTHNTLKFATSSNSGEPFIPPAWSTLIFRKLLANQEFRIKFIQRFSSYLNTIFSSDTVLSMIDRIQGDLSPEMSRHIARWRSGEPYYGEPIADYGTWLTNIEVLRTFARNRPHYQRQHIIDYFQLSGTAVLKMSLPDPGTGEVRVNSVERLTHNSSGIYFKGIPTELQAVPKVGYRFVKWEGLADAFQNPVAIVLTDDTLAVSAVFETININILPAVISSDTTLTVDNSPYYAKSNVLVDSGITLSIEAGVQILMPENSSMVVQGRLLVEGTSTDPVVISPNEQARNWGALCFVNATDSSVIDYINLIGATEGPDFSRDRAAISGYNSRLSLQHVTVNDVQSPVFIQYGQVAIKDCQLHTEYAGDLINVKYAEYALTENCELMGGDGFDSDGIDYDQIMSGIIRGNKIFNIYGFNSDAIDLGEGARDILVERNLIFNINDKGVSVGQASTARIERNLIANCGQGIGIKDFNSYAWIAHNTFYANHYAVASFEKNTGHGGGNGDVVNCLMVNSIRSAILVDHLSRLNVSYSLSNTDTLDGLHNLLAEPLLINNLKLSPYSPAIDNGSPLLPHDPDGSLPDLGAYPLDQDNQTNLIIDEIHYHPPAGENDEFIELVNAGLTAIHLNGYKLAGSIDYTFGEVVIAGSEYIIVAKNGEIYQSQGYQVLQWAAGNLPDWTGNILLYDNLGNMVDMVYYDSQSLWPTQPDGQGPSLELHHLSLENLSASSWRSSYVSGGTPGKSNNSVLLGGVYINEFMADNGSAYTDDQGDYDDWLELYNSNSVPVNVGGLYLTDNLSDPDKYQIPNYASCLTTIPAEGFLVMWADGQTDQGIHHLSFKLDRSGEHIAITQLADSGLFFVDSLTFREQATNISFGRYPDGTSNWYSFDQPTPMAGNRLTNNLTGDPVSVYVYSLAQNYPNPFNPVTTIIYSIIKTEIVKLDIFNILGQKVASPVNEIQPAGTYVTQFDGSNFASGIYFYRVQAGDFHQVRKMVLIR